MYLQKTISILLITLSLNAFGQGIKPFDQREITGTPTEQFDLGMNSFYGNFVPKNIPKGIYLIKKAAEKGHLKAQLNLARAYFRGYKIKKDAKKAFYWATKAAKQNNSEAQYYVGEMYLKGHGTKKDVKKGVAWILKARNQGYAKAFKKWNNLHLAQVNS